MIYYYNIDQQVLRLACRRPNGDFLVNGGNSPWKFILIHWTVTPGWWKISLIILALRCNLRLCYTNVNASERRYFVSGASMQVLSIQFILITKYSQNVHLSWWDKRAYIILDHQIGQIKHISTTWTWRTAETQINMRPVSNYIYIYLTNK